jgi:hypothetical protein
MFTLVKQPIYSQAIVGTGVASVAHLADVEVRHVRTLAKTAPTSATPAGGVTTHAWSGLTDSVYLLVIVFDETAGGSGVVIVRDDATLPASTRVFTVDVSTQVGFVVVAAPVSASLEVEVPDALTVDDIYVQTYAAPYVLSDIDL